MKEKNIRNIIKGFTEQYGYLLEDLRSKDSKSELWTVSKDIGGEQCRLIFISKYRLNELKQYDIPEDKNNIYILFSEDELKTDDTAENIAITNLLGKALIRVNVKERKVNYSENVSLEVVQNLAALMSNIDLYGEKEKVSLKHKPWITMSIIAINIVMYIVTLYLSYVYPNENKYDSYTNALVLLGAKVNELISAGQYYRLISSMFLHGGILHLAVNMYSLYAMGPIVEKLYGKAKYIIIYFMAGICSSIFSYVFSTSISIGASGAIFGLLGAVLVFAIKTKGKTGSAFIKNILSVIFVNIFIGMTLPNIDNFGHIGGLLGGILISLLVAFRTEV